MKSTFFSSLHHRGMFKVGAAYIVSSWGIAKIAELATDKFHLPESAMQWVLIALLVGFPLVLTLAWFMDVSTLDLSFEEDDNELKVLPTVASATATAGLLNRAINVPPEVGPDAKSVAILPFRNMSTDPENEFFADGLAEELLNLLAKIGELKVSSRTSSFSFKGKNVDIREISRQLSVAYLLEGSVRKSSSHVRVTVQLIQASDGFHVWSETYDRIMDDIFALQEEIAQAVVDTLKVNLLGHKIEAYRTDPTAFAFYLKGDQLMENREEQSIDKALEAFQQALALDPDYPAALLGLSGVYMSRMIMMTMPEEEGRVKGREAIDRALRVDPSSPNANSVSALFAASFERDLPTALAATEIALKTAGGDAQIARRLATVLSNCGDHERALQMAEQSVRVDPLNGPAFHNLSRVLLSAGRLPEARTAALRALHLIERPAGTRAYLATASLLEGQPERAIAEVAEEAREMTREQITIMAHHDLGKRDVFTQELDQYISMHGSYAAFQIAEIYAHVGDADATFMWLERALEDDDGGLGTLLSNVFLANQRSDPRWPVFCEKAGLTF